MKSIHNKTNSKLYGALLALLVTFLFPLTAGAQKTFTEDMSLSQPDRNPQTFNIPAEYSAVDITLRFHIDKPSMFGPVFFSPSATTGSSSSFPLGYTVRLFKIADDGARREYTLKYRPMTGRPCGMNAYVSSGDYMAQVALKNNTSAHELRFTFIIDNLLPPYSLDVPVPAPVYPGLIPYIPEPDSDPSYASPVAGITSGRSYIRRKLMLDTSGGCLDRIQYFDGLGRPVQTVRKGVTPGGKDLVDFIDYDKRGRAWRQWNAVPVSGMSGAFISNMPEQAPGILGDTRPYSETLYEESPWGRPLLMTDAGIAWKEHPVQTVYTLNRASGEYSCRQYKAGSDGTLQDAGMYPSGTLEAVKTTDEDGKVSYTFTDKRQRTVLTRLKQGDETYDTYYVYDAEGNLGFVLQPMYQSHANLDLYAFRYEYDAMQRCISKKLPGAEPVEYEYDSCDRLSFSQDGNQRPAGRWTYYLYDAFGRLTEQGECSSKNLSSGRTAHVRNFYDGYAAFREATGYDSAFHDDTSGYAHGALTGSVTTSFGSDTPVFKAYYYDNKGRTVKVVESNLLGGYETTGTVYTLTDKPLTVTHTHTGSGKLTRTETYAYTYDHADRLSRVEHTLDGAKVTLVANTYDEWGRLSSRTFHGSSTNSLAYTYNIRGWLTEIGGGKFTQDLYYNTGNGTPCYNGNISSMTWKTGNESNIRGYKFDYDGVNRLASAMYGETASIDSNTDRFTERVTGYDSNGNITGLQRYGQTSVAGYGLVDNLSFTLDGNRLNRVDDATTASAYNGSFEFKDGASQAGEYTYDANGNLTKDLNKNIIDIQYNVLNLPSAVTFADGSVISYLYSADGVKLRTVHTINGTATTTDYCGNVVYENGVARLLLTEVGYITLSDKKYHYYLQDHQGNNRVVVNQSGSVEETNHYYPFGGVFASSGNVQPYKYNGKELDTKKGLDWYDYGARRHDAALGRFTTVDPMAEKYYSTNPYAYCLNNPINFIDPTGQFVSPIYDRNGRLLGTDDEGLEGKAIIMDKSNFKQGMSHEEALSHSLGYEGLIDDQARSNYTTSYTELKDRPDYDGYLTKSEADAWWRGKSGEPLFVDQSKIELHGINTSSFKKKNPISKNFIWRLTNTGKVYGTLKMTLVDAEKGKVFIGLKSYMDKYDFNMDGRFFRDFATWVGRPGKANDGKDFLIHSYGYAIVPVIK